MKNPNQINRMTQQEVEKAGWVAEARDSDGHLISTLAWYRPAGAEDNLASIVDFCVEYGSDMTVTIFPDALKAKIGAKGESRD